MLEEVLSRVNLIISVEGSRRISRENLDFMFEKYQLSKEDQEKVLTYCQEQRIQIFQDSLIPAKSAENETPVEPVEKKEAPVKKEKKGFFARLFG